MLPTWEEDDEPVSISIGVVVGDKIWVGRTVAILGFEGAKATGPIESHVDGIVEQIFMNHHDYVSSGQLFMLIRTSMEAI